MFSKREATQMATLAPASHWLRKSGLLAQQGNRILVHAMSHVCFLPIIRSFY